MDKENYLIKLLSSKHIGDDGAVIDNIVYSSDMFFENVHFKREWMSLKQIATKAMIVNISDAVAMNAKPKYALISLSLPSNISINEIDILIKTLEEVANTFKCQIIGGDTISGNKLDISITIISETKNPLTRKGLNIGDFLAFTGDLGESKKDLNKLLNGEKISLKSKFYEPILREEFIENAINYLSAGMDISDGLFSDTNKILDINNLGFKKIITVDDNIGDSGEEYEMLIGFKKKNITCVKKIANKLDLKLTIFAEIVNNKNRFLYKKHHFL